jgi:hypothetical protein
MRRALFVAALGLMAVAGCTSDRSSAPGGVVPWVNRPLPLYHTPQPQLIRYPATAPLCRAGQLRASRGRGGAATGRVLEELVFTNAGPETCLLRGYPTITAETPAGRRLTLHPGHGTFFGKLVPADLRPGGHVLLLIETDDMCAIGGPPAVRYHRLAFRLPWGGVVTGRRLTIIRECGLAISTFGRPERYVEPRARPDTAGTLQARVHIGAKVRAGATELRYVVTVRNPGARPVRLHPCPGYTESVFFARSPFQRSFVLNCEAVHAIPARGSVSFEMRLPLPRPLPAGGALVKLGWGLDTPTGPFVGRGLVTAK